jgi:hypothetical protein
MMSEILITLATNPASRISARAAHQQPELQFLCYERIVAQFLRCFRGAASGTDGASKTLTCIEMGLRLLSLRRATFTMPMPASTGRE